MDAAEECDYKYYFDSACQYPVNNVYVTDIGYNFVLLHIDHYRYESGLDYFMIVEIEILYFNEIHDRTDVIRITNLSRNTNYVVYYSIRLHVYHLDKTYTH